MCSTDIFKKIPPQTMMLSHEKNKKILKKYSFLDKTENVGLLIALVML